MDKLAESLGLPVYVGVILELAAGLLLALFAAWIAVWLTRNKFRSERWWGKKAAAYERVIDAFHKAKRSDTTTNISARKSWILRSMMPAKLNSMPPLRKPGTRFCALRTSAASSSRQKRWRF